ncbi:DUF1801 domain-containing protein [Terricaulis sp.]|uniref:DUF1801 domain-containing protein n=1 Tax=Terricaulis sp. TaxID=2768686 RepID=UPI0037847495
MAKATKTATKAATTKKVASDWRHAIIARARALIEEADPEAVEEAKWKKASNLTGVPTWSHDGVVCTGEIYKTHVKFTFAHGAKLKDPGRLFNASLDGGTRRAIDLQEGDALNEKAFKALVREAVSFNAARAKKR